MAEILRHYLSENGNAFVAVFGSESDAERYTPPQGAIALPDAPGIDYDWSDGEWVKRPEVKKYRALQRPAFLFMMNKIGVTEAHVEALIASMPDGTEEEADAKSLALIVFRNQQTFSRDNRLLQTLVDAAGISPQDVDAAWLAAQALSW